MDLHQPQFIHGHFRGGDPADHSQLACNGTRCISQTSRTVWGLWPQLEDTTRKTLIDCIFGLVWCPRPAGANSIGHMRGAHAMLFWDERTMVFMQTSLFQPLQRHSCNYGLRKWCWNRRFRQELRNI